LLFGFFLPRLFNVFKIILPVGQGKGFKTGNYQ